MGVAIAAVAAVLVVFVVLPQIAMKNVPIVDTSLKTVTVEKTNIEATAEGSGSLSAGDSLDVSIPAVLKLKKVNVEAGDTVKAGDVLATLDMEALQDSIMDAQDSISSIDTKLESGQDDSEAKSISTSVDGRVKQINVRKGDSISDVIEQKGALMVLSLDGKMKVNFTSSAALSTGDKVKVVLPDDSKKEGTVTATTSEMNTVTLTDNGPALGDEVTVEDSDGNALGTGKLEINTPLTILGSNGVVDEVKVSLNDSVSSGKKLIALADGILTREYETLLRQRDEYEQLLRKLLEYQKSGAVTAPQDGAIGEIVATEQGSATAEDAASAATTDASSLAGMMPTAYAGQTKGTAISIDTGETVNLDNASASITLLSNTTEGTDENNNQDRNANNTDNGAEPGGNNDPGEPGGTISAIGGKLNIFINNPVTGNTPQSTIMPGVGYTGTVVWQPAAQRFEQMSVYTAMVSLKANAGYRFAEDVQPNVSGAQVTNIAVSPEAEANTLVFAATFPPTEMSMSGGTGQTGNAGSALSGLSGVTGSSGMSLGGSAASSLASAADTTSATGTSTGALDEQVLLTMQTGLVGTLTVDVDELDIVSVQVGQKATIVLDALPDEVFTGTVEKISAAGSAQSGVTTYPVKIALDKADARLLENMNATATIVTAVSENILSVPMDALQELGAEKFVYVVNETQAPAETSQQGQPQPLGEKRIVETGISDGLNVEIVSGLSEGETVIYEDKSSQQEDPFSMMMGGGRAMGGGGANTRVQSFGGPPQ